MLVKITTKHASYSLVTFVTHKRFAVLYFLPSRCVNSLFTSQRSAKRERIRSVILLVLSCISSSSRFLITVAEPDHQIRDGEGAPPPPPHFIDLELRSGNFIRDNESYPELISLSAVALPELVRINRVLRILSCTEPRHVLDG